MASPQQHIGVEASSPYTGLKDKLFDNIYGSAIEVGVLLAGAGLLTILRSRMGKSVKEIQERLEPLPEISSDKERLVYKEMGRLMEVVQAHRCAIVQFHNGIRLSSGRGWKRYSITHETCSPGVSSSVLLVRNLPISFLVEELAAMRQCEKGHIFVSDIDDSTLDKGVLHLLGIKAYHAIALRSREGGDVGVLYLQYNEEGKAPDQFPEKAYDLIATINHLLLP